MTTRKVAITVPPTFLKRLDEWARKMGRSRSRFIVEELDKRLRLLEDEEVTQLYNKVCSDSATSADDHDLAEEMMRMSSIHEQEEKERW